MGHYRSEMGYDDELMDYELADFTKASTVVNIQCKLCGCVVGRWSWEIHRKRCKRDEQADA